MGLISAIRDRFRREDVTLQLDDIQALILRNRPEPDVGIHAMLHIDDTYGGRDLIALRHVAFNGDGAAADFLRDGLGPRAVKVQNRDPCPFPCEGLGDALAEPRCGARHHGRLSLKPHAVLRFQP